jgi:hypothetical protein
MVLKDYEQAALDRASARRNQERTIMATPKKPAKDQPAAPETTELDTSKLVRPNEDVSAESTPLADEAEVAARAKHEATPIADEITAETGIDPPAPSAADSHEDDVQHALSRDTQDGPGEEDPGPSDWRGYATEGVEVEEGR